MQALLRARSNTRSDTRCNKNDLVFELFNRKGAFLVIDKCAFVSGWLGHTKAKGALPCFSKIIYYVCFCR